MSDVTIQSFESVLLPFLPLFSNPELETILLHDENVSLTLKCHKMPSNRKPWIRERIREKKQAWCGEENSLNKEPDIIFPVKDKNWWQLGNNGASLSVQLPPLNFLHICTRAASLLSSDSSPCSLNALI